MPDIIDQETGEVLPRVEPAKSFAKFLEMLEDGELHHELSEELQDLTGDLSNHAMSYGSVAKGKIGLDIEIILKKNGIFEINVTKKVTKPKKPRIGTVLWSTPGNNLTPQNPKQQDMFKDVNEKKALKNIG